MGKHFTRDKQGKIALICETFLELLKTRNYAEISTNHIAEKANIGIGTLYRHFPSGKADIVYSVIKDRITKMMNLSTAGIMVDTSKFDVNTFLRSYIKQQVAWHKSDLKINYALEQAILEDPMQFKDIRDVFLTQLDDYVKLLHQVPQFRTSSQAILKEKVAQVFHLNEALIHRHFMAYAVADSDESLVDFLFKLSSYILLGK